MTPHSSTLAWKIPRTEEPGGLQSMGSLRVGDDWATSLSLFTSMHWRRKWQPTPVFPWGIPGMGEPGGLLSLGSHRVGHDWRDLAAAAAGSIESWGTILKTKIKVSIMNAENTSLLLLFHLPKIGSQCTPAMQSFDILLLVLTLAQQRDLKLLTLELYPMKWPKQMVPQWRSQSTRLTFKRGQCSHREQMSQNELWETKRALEFFLKKMAKKVLDGNEKIEGLEGKWGNLLETKR